MNGHKDAAGNYHYHATEKYPYINGGFYGEVVEREGQVDPQPRAEPVRPALPPMQGAKITRFERDGKTSTLTYEVQGRTGTVRYTQTDKGTVDFVFTDPSGRTKSESFTPRRREPPRREGRPERPERERALNVVALNVVALAARPDQKVQMRRWKKAMHPSKPTGSY